MTPPKHVNIHAKKLFGEMGRIVDGSVAYIELNGGGPTELHTHEHNHLFIVTEGAKFVDYLKKKEIKTNFLIAFTVKTKRDIISLTMGQRNYTAATFSHILLCLLANLEKSRKF